MNTSKIKSDFDGSNWTRNESYTVVMALLESIAVFVVITQVIIPLIQSDWKTGLSVSFLFGLNIRGRYYKLSMEILMKRLLYLQLLRKMDKNEDATK